MSLDDIIKIKKNNKWRNQEINNFSIILDDTKAVYFNKLLDCMCNYTETSIITLENDKMIFKIMDNIRSISAKIIKQIEYDKKPDNIEVNLIDLRNITSNKKDMKISFFDEKIVVEKSNKKGFYTIKSLNLYDLKLVERDNELLYAIEYDNYFSITKENILDLFKETGDFSEVIGIGIDKDCVYFFEYNEFGNFKYPILKEDLVDYKFEYDTEVYILFDIFKKINPILNLLDDKESIKFYIKEEHPLRLNINLEKIETYMDFFLAPRIFKDEDDENDDIEVDLDELERIS